MSRESTHLRQENSQQQFHLRVEQLEHVHFQPPAVAAPHAHQERAQVLPQEALVQSHCRVARHYQPDAKQDHGYSVSKYPRPRGSELRKTVNGRHSYPYSAGAHSSCSIVGKSFLWAHLPQSAVPVATLDDTRGHRPNGDTLSLLSKR